MVLDLKFNLIKEGLLRKTGTDYLARKHAWKARYTKRILLFVINFAKDIEDIGDF